MKDSLKLLAVLGMNEDDITNSKVEKMGLIQIEKMCIVRRHLGKVV